MDEIRFHELQAKARTRGLSDDEANELGRLYAEADGKPYGHAEPKLAGSTTPTPSPRTQVPARRRLRLFRFRTPRSLEIGQTASILGDGTKEPDDRATPAA